MPKTYFYVFDYQMKDGDYPQVSETKESQAAKTPLNKNIRKAT